MQMQDSSVQKRWFYVVFFCVVAISSQGVTKGAALRFLINGDWGGKGGRPYVSHIQRLVAKEMSNVAQKNDVEFVISTGDNFYETGVKSEHDERFARTFEDVYADRSLQVPWHVILGNHDWIGNTSAQIEYTKKSTRWNLPDYKYTLNFTIPRTQETVTIVMIDTVILCGYSSGFTSLPGPSDPEKARQIYKWIEDELVKARSSEYLLVVGHYPIFSVGLHGSDDCLRNSLLPLLYKYEVSAYICGHDHNLQHMVSVSGDHRLSYFVVGSGARLSQRMSDKGAVPTIATEFFSADKSGGFALMEITADSGKVTFINGKGEIVHTGSFDKRKSPTKPNDHSAQKDKLEEWKIKGKYRKNNANKQYADMYKIPDELPRM